MKGFIQIPILILLLVGTGASVYLVQQKTHFFSQAFSGISSKEIIDLLTNQSIATKSASQPFGYQLPTATATTTQSTPSLLSAFQRLLQRKTNQLPNSPLPTQTTTLPTPMLTSITIPTTAPIPTPTPTPIAKITCTINTSVSTGWSPVGVYFSYSASDQSKVTGNQWDLDGDGTWESETSTPNWIYKEVKSYEAKLKLKLLDGSYSDICSKTITVNPPSITCSINASDTSGQVPLAVDFTYSASFYGVSDDYVTDVQWDFNGDGTWDTPYDYSSQHPPVYTFSNPGNYTAKMHLKTHKGVETDVCTKSITAN